MPSINECLAHAEECERQAAMAVSDIVRKHFLTSAASWRRQAMVPALAQAILREAKGPQPPAKPVQH